MYRIATAVIGIAMLTTSFPAFAGMGGGDAMGVEVARANARAGGPISDHDKDLLERYGCLENTPYCRRLRQKNFGRIDFKPSRHKQHRKYSRY